MIANDEMDRLVVNGFIIGVLLDGPTRVVVNSRCNADPPAFAAQLGFVPDVVFIRNDGWSLGAPSEFVRVAEDLWRGQWVARLDLRTSEVEFLS